MSKNNVNIESFLAFSGLLLIALYSFFVLLYNKYFAELNVQFDFFDFPVFVSEITLSFCVFIFVLMSLLSFVKFNKWHILVGLYVLWILIKAAVGYHTHGPLALRNAALFYYPLFGVLTYEFYRRYFFSKWVVVALFLLLLLSKFVFTVDIYYILPCIFLSFFLLSDIKLKNPVIFVLVILLIIYTPAHIYLQRSWSSLDFFFYSSRSRVLGHCMAFLFLCLVYFLFFLKMPVRFKICVLLFAFIALIVGVGAYADKNALQSMMSVKRIFAAKKDYDLLIASRRKDYVKENLTPKLFAPESSNILIKLYHDVARVVPEKHSERTEVQDRLAVIYGEILNEERMAASKYYDLCFSESFNEVLDLMNRLIRNNVDSITMDELKLIVNLNGYFPDFDRKAISKVIGFENLDSFSISLTEIHKNLYKKLNAIDGQKHIRIQERMNNAINEEQMGEVIGFQDVVKHFQDNVLDTRDLGTAVNNILFRLYIWEDMVNEIRADRALMGINWGRPQRSESIEMLGWARGEWSRDGWITPHNSFLHIIYRGGIVGVAFLIGLVSLLVYLIRGFIRLKCLPGIFLMTIFVYWMTIANFLVFLEFPYNAIHFWGLLGMTLAFYRDQLKAAEARV